jgi:Rrf2 family protein
MLFCLRREKTNYYQRPLHIKESQVSAQAKVTPPSRTCLDNLIDKGYQHGNNIIPVSFGQSMIAIRRDTDYAARIILHLSMLGEGAQITAEEVSRKRMLPRAFVRRIIRRLGAAGILRTLRGAGGGIALSRSSAQISLLDIIRAMEGELAFSPCVDSPPSCPLSSDCPVRRSWATVTEQLSNSLGAIHFDDLAKDSNHSHRLKSGNPRAPAAGQTKREKKGEGRGRR